MITVGLINELRFISMARKTCVESTLKCDDFLLPIKIIINEGRLNVHYRGQHIWSEDVSSNISMFGVESVDNLARIVKLIDANDISQDVTPWKELTYFDNALDKK